MPKNKRESLIFTLTMCTLMVLIMSMYGAFMGVGFSMAFFALWLANIPLNFIVAYPLQILAVGPLVRYGFRRVCPA